MRRWWLPALAAALLGGCGGGKSGTGAAEQAAAADGQARQQALATPTRLAVSIVTPADPLLQGLTIPSDAPTKGLWSAVQNWPMNAIHLALLPDGRVTSYGSLPGSPDVSWGRSFDFWTPSLGFGANAHNTVRIDSAVNSFCDSQTLLPDGNMLLTGGVDSTLSGLLRWKTTDVVDTGSKLSNDRWYSTAITLPDGRAVTVGGMDINSEGVLLSTPDTAVANGVVSMTPEVYAPAVGWRSLSGATNRQAFGPEQVRASFPKAWVAPNGLVFGISVDTMWQLDVNANGGLGATSVLGAFKTPYSATSPVNVGTMATAVMFAPGRILQVGGNGGVAGEALPGSNLATVVDINGPAPLLSETSPMTQRRRMGNSLVLPNGSVVVTGGSRFANQIGTDAVYEAELWNPATGAWTTGAAAKVERVYHSTTLLLPNGTVLSAGGGAPGPVNNQNAEIYYPPYLFQSVAGGAQLAPRPVLTGINATSFGYGQAVRVEMAAGQTAARLVLLRSGTVTHAFNNSQRFIELPFTQTGDFINATVPANPNLAPPGVYQLVVLDAAGVPSAAVLVGLGQTGSTVAAFPVLTRGQTYAFSSAANGGAVLGADAAGQGTLLAAPDATSVPAAAQFILRDGLANASCVSLESKASAGKWLRHVNLRVGVGANDASAGFAAQATFCPEPAPGGQGIVLRSASHPGYVLRHRSGQIWVDLEAPTADFVANSSFVASAVTAAAPVAPAVTPAAQAVVNPVVSAPSVAAAPRIAVANLAPTVAVTAPLAGATVRAGDTITIKSNPGDTDGYITKVAFYDGTHLIGTVTSRPWSIQWTADAGVHNLSVKAFDNAGASSVSLPVALTVLAGNQPPTVSITAPATPASGVAGTAVVVNATAADADGSVVRVEFYDGTTLLGTDSSAPYSLAFTGRAGLHSLTAKAIDNTGAATISTLVALTLTPSPVVVPPLDAVACAPERSTCVLPQGATASVYYGAAGKYVVRTGLTGSVACNNTTFGDPLVGTVKACSYGVTSSVVVAPALGTGLEGAYFSNANLGGAQVRTRVEAINFDWGLGSPSGVPADLFSARWSGFIEAPATGNFLLRTVSDDGVRVWVDGVLVIDNWTVHAATVNTSPAIPMKTGEHHAILVEYQEFYREAVMQLQWQVPGSTVFVPVPANRLYGP